MEEARGSARTRAGGCERRRARSCCGLLTAGVAWGQGEAPLPAPPPAVAPVAPAVAQPDPGSGAAEADRVAPPLADAAAGNAPVCFAKALEIAGAACGCAAGCGRVLAAPDLAVADRRSRGGAGRRR